MPKWDKIMIPPHYLGSACKGAKWPPDKGNSSKEFTDEEVVEMEKRGYKVRRAGKS